jgi:hypothetical protein
MQEGSVPGNVAWGTFTEMLENDTPEMTFFIQGFATLPWGQPPASMVQEIDDIVRTTPAEESYLRGKFNSRESKALTEFMMYNTSEERVCLQSSCITKLICGCRRNIFIVYLREKEKLYPENLCWWTAGRSQANRSPTGPGHMGIALVKRLPCFVQPGAL